MFIYVRLEQKIQNNTLDPILSIHLCGHPQVFLLVSISSSWMEERHTKQRQKNKTTPDPTSYLKFCCVPAPLICSTSGEELRRPQAQSNGKFATELAQWWKRVKWLARVVKEGNWSFAWCFGEKGKENGVASSMEEVFVNWESAAGTAIFFQGPKIPTTTCSKRLCSAAAGQGQPHRRDKKQENCRKGFFFSSPASVQMEGK